MKKRKNKKSLTAFGRAVRLRWLERCFVNPFAICNYTLVLPFEVDRD